MTTIEEAMLIRGVTQRLLGLDKEERVECDHCGMGYYQVAMTGVRSGPRQTAIPDELYQDLCEELLDYDGCHSFCRTCSDDICEDRDCGHDTWGA